MTKLGPLDVLIMVEGLVYASRQWHVVPRVGDTMMLRPQRDGAFAEQSIHEAGRKTLYPYDVIMVVWGVEEPEHYKNNRQRVQVHVVKREIKP